MEQTPRRKLFYGWVCVLGAFFISAAIGVQYSVFSLFVIPVTTELGCTRTQFTLILTIFSLVAMVESPIIGRIAKKVPARLLILGGLVGHTLVYLGYSVAHSLAMFYACAFLLGVSCQLSNQIVINHVLNKWFIDKKGLATGIAYCGSGICLLFMSPLLQTIINTSGWRWAYRAIALCVVLFNGIAVLLIRESPESMGLKPLGWDKQNASAPADAPVDPSAEAGITFKESTKSPALYLWLVGMFLMMIIPQGINPNLSPFLQSAGYSATFAASVLSISSFLQMPVKIGLGMAFDRMSRNGIAISEGLIMVASPLLMIVMAMNGSGVAWIAMLLALLFAFNYSLINIGQPATVTMIFGRKDFTQFMGFSLFALFIANTFAGSIMASSFDKTGSYMGGVWIYVGVGVAACVCFLLANIVSRKWMAPKEKAETK